MAQYRIITRRSPNGSLKCRWGIKIRTITKRISHSHYIGLTAVNTNRSVLFLTSDGPSSKLHYS